MVVASAATAPAPNAYFMLHGFGETHTEMQALCYARKKSEEIYWGLLGWFLGLILIKENLYDSSGRSENSFLSLNFQRQ